MNFLELPGILACELYVSEVEELKWQKGLFYASEEGGHSLERI